MNTPPNSSNSAKRAKISVSLTKGKREEVSAQMRRSRGRVVVPKESFVALLEAQQSTGYSSDRDDEGIENEEEATSSTGPGVYTISTVSSQVAETSDDDESQGPSHVRSVSHLTGSVTITLGRLLKQIGFSFETKQSGCIYDILAAVLNSGFHFKKDILLHREHMECLIRFLEPSRSQLSLRECLALVSSFLKIRIYVICANEIKTQSIIKKVSIFNNDQYVVNVTMASEWSEILSMRVPRLFLVSDLSLDFVLDNSIGFNDHFLFGNIRRSKSQMHWLDADVVQRLLVASGVFEPAGILHMRDVPSITTDQIKKESYVPVMLALTSLDCDYSSEDVAVNQEIYGVLHEQASFTISYNSQARTFQLNATFRPPHFVKVKQTSFSAFSVAELAVRVWLKWREAWKKVMESWETSCQRFTFPVKKDERADVLLQLKEFVKITEAPGETVLLQCFDKHHRLVAANWSRDVLLDYIAVFYGNRWSFILPTILKPETAQDILSSIQIREKDGLFVCDVHPGRRGTVEKATSLSDVSREKLVCRVWDTFGERWSLLVHQVPKEDFRARLPVLSNPLPIDERKLMEKKLHLFTHSRDRNLLTLRAHNGAQQVSAKTTQELYDKTWQLYGTSWQQGLKLLE